MYQLLIKWKVSDISRSVHITRWQYLIDWNVNTCIGKGWTAFERLSIILKSDLSDKIPREFFQAVATQEYFVLFWKNIGSINQQNSSCTATYLLSQKVWWARHAVHYLWSKDEHINDVVPWISTDGATSFFNLVWLGWILWHINHCRLFNAKSSLYVYIRHIWFCLVWIYGISTIGGYLMPNPIYTYTLNL